MSTDELEVLIEENVDQDDEDFNPEERLRSDFMIDAGYDNADSIITSTRPFIFIGISSLCAIMAYLTLLMCRRF